MARLRITDAGGGERTRPRAVPVPVGTFKDIVVRAPTPRRPVVGVGPRLGDERAFVHKRIFGGIKGAVGGLIGGGSPITGAIRGFVRGGRPQPPPVAVVPQTTVVPGTLFGGKTQCPAGFVNILGRCIPTGLPSAISDPRSIGISADGMAADVGMESEARVGRFGAGLEPAGFESFRLSCPPGSVLGKQEADGSFLCYNKRDISNKERKWPKGRRPLLTGGEMRCISVASRAAKSLQRKEKQLQQLGLLKRPSRGRQQKQLPPGHVAQITHAG